jgi:hypothetical protein
MARINSVLYFDEFVDAFDVDDNYSEYEKDKFECPKCHAKMQYNRGIHCQDPHFKNWPNVEHLKNCEISINFNRFAKYDNKNIDVIVSTILPRAKRLMIRNNKFPSEKLIKRYYGKRSKRFLIALNMLTNNEFDEITLITEDGETVKLNDIVLRQDEIIEKMENGETGFICVLKGYTTKKIEIGGSIKIPLTHNGKYKNKNKFDLFMPASFVEKNNEYLTNIENKLVNCYGIPEKNEYGYKINVYSIEHQIYIREKK